MVKLVKPSIKYKQSFIEAAKEFMAEGRNKDSDILEFEKNFAALTTNLENEEKGIGLKDGYVPSSTRWLVDREEFIGRVSIRHKLTEKLAEEGGHIGYEIRPSKRNMGYGSKILEMAIPVADKLGIKKILITCDDDNVGSWKIIEKNGGVLQDKVETHGKLIRRYWVEKAK